MKNHITQNELKELFIYKDGNLYYKYDRYKTTIKAGDIAGCYDNRGYKRLYIKGRSYRLHRLIFLYVYGNINDLLHIDHINGIKDDNRIENLRLVTCQENTFNRIKAKGYSFKKSMQKFQSSIMFNGKLKHLGYFDNENEARSAYLEAKQKVHTFDKNADDSIMKTRKQKGYSWNSAQNKFVSYIRINGKQKHLGLFNTEEEAREAYLNAKQKYNI